MKKFPAILRNVSSFIAGILVGLSLWIMVFALMDAFPDEWQTLPVFGASIILVLGIALQIVATSTTRPPSHRRTDPELPILPIELMESSQIR
jgi:cytochrome c biogenesis protein CcdA